MEKAPRKKSFTFKIKISAKRKKEITDCAAIKGVTVNHFIKDAINQSLINHKTQSSENGVLRNQLELFNIEDYFKNGTQLNIEL